MKKTVGFTAEDGATFATAADCRQYEEIVSLSSALGNLAPGNVHAALFREHIELADAFERAGAIIAAKRRASGDVKRAVKKPDAFEGVVDAMVRAREDNKRSTSK